MSTLIPIGLVVIRFLLFLTIVSVLRVCILIVFCFLLNSCYCCCCLKSAMFLKVVPPTYAWLRAPARPREISSSGIELIAVQ